MLHDLLLPLLHKYPRDREWVRTQALIESEMQSMETDNSPSRAGQEGLQLQFAEFDGQITNRSIIDIKYGDDEDPDFDENDERPSSRPRLLSLIRETK